MKNDLLAMFSAMILWSAVITGCAGTDPSQSGAVEAIGTDAETETETEIIADPDQTDASAEPDWSSLIQPGWQEHTAALNTGIAMSYMTCGPEDGEPLLLIHGATDSRISWSQAAPILAEAGFRCYIPELRGHGKTDKPEAGEEGYTAEQHCKDLIGLLDELKIDEISVAGHSLGSIVAQELMITSPGRVRGAVLVSSSARIVDNPTLDWVLNGDGEEFSGVRGYEGEGRIPDAFIKSWTETTNEDEHFREAVYLHAKSLPYEDWYRIFKGCDDVDNRERLAAVTCPVDILWGTGDTLFTAEDQEVLRESFINAKVNFVEIEGAGHNVHWDSETACRQVTDEIMRFMNETDFSGTCR